MLKNCFLPIQYNNLTNKTCGEIVCQSETAFSIICKFCDLRIFEYEEFLQHFRNNHWTQQLNVKNEGGNEVPDEIENEKDIKPEIYEETKILCDVDHLDETEEDLETNEDDEWQPEMEEEYNEDSNDMTVTKAILKKPVKVNKKRERPFKCEMCTRTFSNKSNYEAHKLKHKTVQYNCDKCSKTFVTEHELGLHQRSHNGYSCPICNMSFMKYESLRTHKESHIETKNFICTYKDCNKAFATKRRLGSHMRLHIREPTLVCELCGGRYRSTKELNDHIRRHTGEKPFACNLCDRRFTSKSLLGEHMACHETERKHVCEVCGKGFNRPKALYHHRHLHLEVKKFVCKICGAAYAQCAGLSAHMRKHKEQANMPTNSPRNDIFFRKNGITLTEFPIVNNRNCQFVYFSLKKKMLKTCTLSTTCTNFTNKTCGEIVCQTETSFIIVCKLCDIKIFDYEEFIKHFRLTHWPEICNDKTITNNYNSKWKNNIKTENDTDEEEFTNNDCDKGNVAIEIDIKQPSKGGRGSDSEEENRGVVTENELEHVNSSEDSEDLSKSLVILKKATDKSSSKEKRFECSECKRKFTTKFYLRFHIRQQHEPKTFQCDKCSKSFVEKRYLTLHQRSHIGYTCQICNKVFDKYEALRYHGESHIESRNFICDYENCGKAFPNNRRLSAHKRSHFALATFVCEICGSRQRSKEFLIVHIRTHTGEKPYACSQCDRRFASKHFLQDHQAVHATERSHVCTVCGKAFASSKSLYHHRHLHSGIKKYVCKICNSAYSQAAGLSAHMRKHKQDSGLLDVQQTTSNT
ncbi:oocyte zinc finger protein XlCOF6-like [Lucilia sericata]|uniref:oocyte zinc finger protein XlCOF6-like n=1 Tax=Lucilia sericata TaxID=13632 RepID=UPI0018A824B5|nr:oocyte zinc finger protein XlCOF6-like [Lucilia sericata]